MGNLTSSSRSNPLELLRDQVKELGNKYPFGDDEILRIGRCLAYIRHTPIALSDDVVNYSFLNNWAVYCSTLPKADFNSTTLTAVSGSNKVSFTNLLQVDKHLIEESIPMLGDHDDNHVDSSNKEYNIKNKELLFRKNNQMEIRKKMSFIEDQILPSKFSQSLEETTFALLSPLTHTNGINCTGNTSTTTMNNDNVDEQHHSMESLAMQRLEYFLNGLADSSRRGSRKALSVIYNCCAVRATAVAGSTSSTFDDNNDKTANAKDLLDLTYRLALSSLLLRRQSHHNNRKSYDDDESEHEEDDNINTDNENISGNSSINEESVQEIDLTSYIPEEIDQSLIQSLLDFATKYSTPNSSNDYYMYDYSNNNNVTSHVFNGAKQKVQDNDKTLVSLAAFTAWVESNAPCLAATLETFIHCIFFPDKKYPPSRLEFAFPNLRGQQSAFFTSETSPLLFAFAAMSPSLGGAWYRLFTSDEDGLSFNRLQNSLLGYGGPTLLIIKDVDGGSIFGAFTSTPWKESKDFYGNSDCFLFQLHPNLKVIRPRGRGTNNFMYCNSESRSRGYDGQAHGIGFGGTIEKPRLFISESFEDCMASSSDLTFEAGALLSPLKGSDDDLIATPTNRKYFEIANVEVWGVGGDNLVKAALGARNAQREIKAANIRKARKVDKAAFLDDFKSGLIESKAFKHREEMRGRDDCHIDDYCETNYDYEKI